MKRIVIFAAALATGVATALALGSLLVPRPAPVTTTMAQWKNIYRTPGGLVAGADLIVVAQHIWAAPGRVVGEGEDAIPFTDNTFSLDTIVKGEHEGLTLTVEQTGGMAADGTILAINDGGPYEPGTSYLLFLGRTGEGSYYLINHQARYRIVDNVLEGLDPTDPVVASMHNAPLDQGTRMIERRMRLIDQ